MVARKQKEEHELSPDDQPSLRREFVQIEHPKAKGQVGIILKSSYDAIWKDRGWTLVDDKKSDAANSGESKKESN